MDFSKFVWTLENQALYFASLNTLQAEDPYEGTLGDGDILMTAIHARIADSERERTQILRGHAKRLAELEKIQRGTHVSCWHMASYEADAMWKLYMRTNEGIAIQTTVGRLKRSLENCDRPVVLGRVRYIDYRRYRLNGSFLAFALHKRRSFAHEKEVRLVLEGDPCHGVVVPVDIGTLIENVYVAHDAPEWTMELLGSLLKRYKLSAELLKRSEMRTKPSMTQLLARLDKA